MIQDLDVVLLMPLLWEIFGAPLAFEQKGIRSASDHTQSVDCETCDGQGSATLHHETSVSQIQVVSTVTFPLFGFSRFPMYQQS